MSSIAPSYRRSVHRCLLEAQALALCLSLLYSSASDAQATSAPSKETTRVLVDLAMRYLGRGDLSAARQALERARADCHDQRLLGQIHLRLGLLAATEGRLAEARRAFGRALDHDPLLRIDPYRHKPRFVELFRKVRRSREGELAVSADPAASIVYINGKRAGPTPFRTTLVSGRYQVTVRATGCSPHEERVEVRPRQLTRVAARLRALVPPASLSRPSGPDRAKAPSRRWLWVALSATAVSAAIVTALLVSANSDYSEACDLLTSPPSACASRTDLRDEADFGRYQDLSDSMSTKRLSAAVIGAVGGAATIAAVVLYLTANSTRDKVPPVTSRANETLAIDLAGPAILLRGRF